MLSYIVFDKLVKKSLFFLSALTLGVQAASAGYLVNFGDPKAASFQEAISKQNVHIVQFGDSHTAGDTMTEALRERLQSVLGKGGMGWAMPMYFSGQRMARFGYDNKNFSPVSSRTVQSGDYTAGGLIARPNGLGATLTLKAKQAEPMQKMLVSIKQAPSDGKFTVTDASGRMINIEVPHKNNTWQLVSFDAKLPITIYNDGARNTDIGGWWALSATGSGATVSAIGINGAELSHWSRWNKNAWQSELGKISPNLVVLAYGTNEAYNNVSAETVRSVLTQKIREVRQATPRSAILVLGAPESLRNTSGGCGTRPNNLTAIQYAQREVAQNERTLYWDWQGAMGGDCSMKSWINSGRASKDGVHFSAVGYTALGQILADDLLSFGRLGGQSYVPTNPTVSHGGQIKPDPIPINIPKNHGSGFISQPNGNGRIFIRE